MNDNPMKNKTEIEYHLQVTDNEGDSWTYVDDHHRTVRFLTREIAEDEAHRLLNDPNLSGVKVLLVEKTPVTTIDRPKPQPTE